RSSCWRRSERSLGREATDAFLGSRTPAFRQPRRDADLDGSRLADHHEAVRSHQLAVVDLGACAEAGPDVPAVETLRQGVAAPVVLPGALQPHRYADRPGAEDLHLAAVELDVVVGRLGVPRPDERRRLLEPRAVLRGTEEIEARHGGCRDPG